MIVGAAAETLDAARGYFWILLAAVVLWRLFPVIRRRLESDDITVESGGKKISLQNASSQLQRGLDDLRTQVIALRERVGGSTVNGDDVVGADVEVASTLNAPVGPPVRILWVDDEPENNAFLIKSLMDRDADVVEASSTDEALAELTSSRRRFDVVISDMGRTEKGGHNALAGVDLVRRVREADPVLPIVIYASPRAVASNGEAALEAGAAGVTASPTELLAMLRIGPTTTFETSVAEDIRRYLGATLFPIRNTVDFVAVHDGKRIGIEVKNWSIQPSRRQFERALAPLAAARERYGFDHVLLITRPAIAPPVDVAPPPWLRVTTADDLAASATRPTRN